MPDVEVEGPDGNTYQFPDGTDKNAAIKYFKAKGIGAAGAATASAPPKLNVGAPSTQPMSQQYLVGGGTPEPLSNTVGRMAHDAVRTQGALSAMVPTAIHRSLQGSGLAGPRSRLFPGEHTPEQLQKEDLPNAALMTEMGAAEGMEAGGEATPA